MTLSVLMLVAVAALPSGASESRTNAKEALCDDVWARYVPEFNRNDEELYTNAVPNSAAEEFLRENAPSFTCPDKDIERTYHFRWWTYRKHIKKSSCGGWVVTEFLPPVPWAGPENTIDCAMGHHVREGRWLKDSSVTWEYLKFMLEHGRVNGPRAYACWPGVSLMDWLDVTGDAMRALELKPLVERNFAKWEKGWTVRSGQEMRIGKEDCGLFAISDNYEGTEMSLSGYGYRPIVNSAMYGEALALARLCRMSGEDGKVDEYSRKAAELEAKIKKSLWNGARDFFTTMRTDSAQSPVRELHGYAPWYFGMPLEGYEKAWSPLMRENGFLAPFGLTFPERSAKGFTIAYKGHECQWNGPSWPYSTSVALTALARHLQGDGAKGLPDGAFAKLLSQYARQHRRVREDGIVVPWIDENVNPFTGDWISRTIILNTPEMRNRFAKERGKDYNHSTFCDLVISGLVGFIPHADGTFDVKPLAPREWEWFSLRNLRHCGHVVDIDYNRASGLLIKVDGRPHGCQSADAEKNLGFYISNHDQSPSHRVIHPIVGQTNFVYDAKGALEKIRGEAIAFYVRDSENVTIRNLRLDWERPCMTEAKIVDIDNGETIVEMDRRLFPVTFIDGRMWMTGPGWTNETKYCKLFDGGTREQTAMAGDTAFDGTARELPGGRIALRHDFSKDGVGAKIGDVIAFRPTRRDFPAIVVYGSKNVTLEDVVVHDAKGMALIAQRSENITWRGTKTAADRTAGVFPRPGSYASSHADASHFSNVKGEVVVENCWFEGMMDDAINVHSTCLAVTNVVRGDTLCCRYMHHQAVGFEVFRPGETLRFIDGDTLENGPEMRVKAVRQIGERDVEVTLETPPPEGWGVGDAVENADYQCSATFRGNVVCNNRARGSLFTTPKPVLVESNLFSKVTGSAILFAGDDYYWYESGACRDVVIRGNVFSNCCTAASRHGYSKGIISFYPIVRDFERQKSRYHGNILVEGNEFSGFDVPLLFAISTENIKWRSNRVSYNDLYAGWEEPPFVFKHCRNVEIDGRAMPGDTKMYTAPRNESDFNDGWEFRKEPDEAWREVRVPHDWAIESRFDPNGEPGAGRLPYAGTGWYRRRFTLPKESEGQCVFLDIGGAMAESDVWLNGILVGGRKFGFSSYRVNLTAALRPAGEENLVEIRCHVPAKSARFYFGAGLYRPLRLVRTPPVHVGRAGVFVKTKILDDGSAAVDAEVDVKGPLAFVNAGARNTFKWGDVRIASRVLGEDGLRIRSPKLWSPESPHLYTLETRLTYAGALVDVVYAKFGVRTLRFNPKRGFFLNGKYRQMKGVCLHHDLGSLGAAFDRGAFERQIKIMKEMGADAIRTSHNPPDPAALDVCDEMGMLVMDEAFDCWNKHKFPADYATWFPEWHNKDFADFVLRDRNHPCVVMWSIGNEIPDTYVTPVPTAAIRTGKELTAIAHRLDPTRPTTMGHCRSFTMTNGMAKATDVYGANYLPSDYGWYLKSGEGRLGLVATETCSAVSTRGESDLKVFRRNNYLPEVEFAAQTNNPACYGEFVWTGFDYLGEPDPYSKKGARSSYYGIVDLCGFPKERYWTYRAHWRPDDTGTPEAESAGPAAKLELTQERFRDLVFVKIRAVDAGGATVTNFCGRLTFAVDGAASIAGVGNGDPMDYDSLKGDSIKAFHGLAQVVVRGASGELSVSSKEFGEQRIRFEK